MKNHTTKLSHLFLALPLLRNIPLLALAAALLAPAAHAQTWTGNAGDGKWETAGNWNTNTVPVATDNATTINPTSAAIYANPHPVISSGSWAIGAFVMNGAVASGWSSTLTINGSGTLAIGTGGNTRIGAAVGNAGYLNITDNGYISFSNANIDFGYNGTGYVTMSGNAVMEHQAINGQAILGEAGVSAGYVTMKDNAIWNISSTMPGALYTGFGGSGGGHLVVQDSARVNVANGGVEMGRTAVSNSEITLTSTNANIADRATLSTKLGLNNNQGSSAKIMFEGGVLQALSSVTNFIRGNITITTEGDGAFIDSNGYDIGIASTVTFSGTSGLTKLGEGALTLGGVTTFTGSTTIEAGTLILTTENQLANSSAVNMASSSTLTAVDLSQTFNKISNAGAINLGSGTLTANNTGNIVFSGPVTASDLIITTPGDFTLSGDNNITGNISFTGALLTLGHDNAIGTGEGKSFASSGSFAFTASSISLAHDLTLQSGLQLAFDTGAGNVTLSGAIAGNAGINKTGSGNLILSGNLSGLSGAINVGGGGLYLSDYTCAGNVSVAAGGAFGASGLITGNLAFAGPGTLQIGRTHGDVTVADPVTLTINGTLSFGGAATLSHDMYTSGHDHVIAAAATFGGATTNVDLVSIQSGTFTLIKLTSGTFSDSIVAPGAITTTQDGGDALSHRSTVDYALNNAKNELLLIAEKINHIINWTGAASDFAWNSSSTNWTGADTKFVSGDKVVFAASDSQSIELLPHGILTSEVSITGNGSYTFTGGHLIVDKTSLGTAGDSFAGASPTGVFTIDTTGTVTLANNAANIFTNGIDLRQGTLIGNVMTLGDAAITNNGKTIIDQADDDIFAGSMTGAGILGKTGAGTLLLDGDFSNFTGKTEIEEGALVIADGAHYASGHIAGTGAGIALYIGDGAIATGSVTIPDGTLFMPYYTSEISGNVSIGATASLVGIGRIGGDVTLAPGSAIIIDASAAIDNAAILHMGNLTLGTGASINGAGTLASTGINLDGNITLQDHYNNSLSPDLMIDASIAGTGGITKVGEGLVALSAPAPSTYSGPTNVLAGTLAAASDNAFSSNSAHTIAAGATLVLNGYSQAVGALANHGIVKLGENGATAGKLRVNGAFTAAPGSEIHLGIVAADKTKTLSGQLSFADAASISGTTVIRAQLTDNRSDKTLIIHDMEPFAIADIGEFAPGSFILDDGQGFNRAILHGIDYVLEYDGGVIDLIATTAAELPAALAANVISIIANRAAFSSVSQRLDYLRAANALPGSDATGLQVWGQTYYRSDKLDSALFPNSDGTAWGFQAGIDKRGDIQGSAHTTYGGFIDRTEATADLPNKTSTDLTSTGIGGYISMRTLGNWRFDGVLRYTWDKYTVNVGRRTMDSDGFTWGAMLRASKLCDLGKNWEFTPQFQGVFQNRKVRNMTDDVDRDYAFGPDNMGINRPSSLEARVGAGIRKVIAINDKVSIAPYVSAHFLYEFRGNLATITVNNTKVSEDFGGDSYLFTLGLPARLTRRLDAYLEATLQTGGPITGHGLNLGINYRW